MTRKKQLHLKKFKSLIPYIVTGVFTLTIVAVGSIDKQGFNTSLSLGAFAANNYDISVDQLSELYMVADLSDALTLASASDVASNYVVTTTMYDAGQTSTDKIEKPILPDISACRGVVSYTVPADKSMQDIADMYGITTDDIRWSNGLKTTDLEEGKVLDIPCASGIVYTVKSNDTIASIVEKYGSSESEIIALNDLEVSGISEGKKILIRGGSLPETERPEYVAPVVRRTVYTYTYLGNTSGRQGIEVVGYFYNLGGPYGRGQCTQWAWYNRQDLPSNLGNANTWAVRAAAIGYTVNRTPSAGAIFQSSGGWYGHVGYVESVNGDGSIVVTEMNYGIPYRVIRSTIPASSVGNFNYIH